MHNQIARRLGAALAAALVGAFGLCTAQAIADSPGIAHFVRFNDSSFDKFTSEPSLSTKEWIDTHIWRMGVFSPYFDDKTSWYPNGWVYRDAYAIYTKEALASEHPEWILRDSSGNKLYIPWGCSGGTCPQYAADISNPAFRHYWIEHVRADYAKGYRGVFVDDVNMDMRVGNGKEELVAPIDPSTGQPMSAMAWRGYMATFMQELRSALPTAEIVHNVIWFADNHAGISDPSIRSELSAANFAYLERGVNDSGLTGGTGSWSVNALLSYIDEVHSLGRNVVLDGSAGAGETPGLEYNLAAYFLISNGNDAVSGKGQTPENWWQGWSVQLGEPGGARYQWHNLSRRDFSGGLVLLNPPGSATQTVTLPGPMQDVNGNAVTSVTLGPASGAILRGAVATSSTSSTSSAGSATETSTSTSVEATPAESTTTTSSGTTTTTSSSTTTTTSTTSSGTTTTSSGTTETTSTTSSTTSAGTKAGHGKTSSKGRGIAHAALVGTEPFAAAPRDARASSKHRAGHRHRVGHRHRSAHKRRRDRRHRRGAVRTRISGLVSHASSGRVTIQLQDRSHGRWVALQSVSTTLASSGRFQRLLWLHPGVRYRVRAMYGGVPGYRPSRSRFRTVTLRRK